LTSVHSRSAGRHRQIVHLPIVRSGRRSQSVEASEVSALMVTVSERLPEGGDWAACVPAAHRFKLLAFSAQRSAPAAMPEKENGPSAFAPTRCQRPDIARIAGMH
jgi:hypothetical protein